MKRSGSIIFPILLTIIFGVSFLFYDTIKRHEINLSSQMENKESYFESNSRKEVKPMEEIDKKGYIQTNSENEVQSVEEIIIRNCNTNNIISIKAGEIKKIIFSKSITNCTSVWSSIGPSPVIINDKSGKKFRTTDSNYGNSHNWTIYNDNNVEVKVEISMETK